MKLVHFYLFGKSCWGALQDDGETLQLLEGNPFDGQLTPIDRTLSLESVRLLPASSRPSKIVCIGSNYRLHCEEMGKPVPAVPILFMKPPSALVAHGEAIRLPPELGRVDFEGELAVIIGRRARNLSRDAVAEHVLGYSILNDVSARELQRSDGQFTRAKGFDTFCPLGPWIATDLDPHDLELVTTHDGVVKQRSRTSDMVFPVFDLVAFISRHMTLEPGDVISTGTPSGVSAIAPGDEVSITIEGIGTLSNTVVPQ